MKNITNMNYIQNINIPYIIYKILIHKYQYSIYTIYILYISIPKLKHIKAAAIGQSEELFFPILNCLNILQPYREDREIQMESEREEEAGRQSPDREDDRGCF